MRSSLVCLAILLPACTGGSSDADATVALVIAPATLPAGQTAAPYVATIAVGGGSGGYQWRIILGALPPGLVGIPASGAAVTLNGTPSTEGSYPFTVEVSDSDGNSATAAYILVVVSGGPGAGTDTSLVNAASGRGMHTAVWTGTEMLVWGGLDTNRFLNTGAAYDPIADSWRTIASIGAPAARFGHTALWTGTEMLVWGGSDSAGLLGTGGAYNPVTDTWRTLSTVGAPERRSLHTAVWTGTRMLVWGGVGVFPPPAPNAVDRVFADGAAYDPATDIWSPIAAGGPATRGHTAVWTGARMIVWAGRDSFALTLSTQNIGGVYDPATDSWTATNVATAPTARVGHTAVWTGTEMLVWGGRDSTVTELASGSRYTPGTDSWSATSSLGAPSPRYGHTAVWTGMEMIVWGGSDSTGPLGTGAFYDPATNSWRPLPTSFAPTPRTDHTAVLAGPQMTVWGGRTNPPVTYLNTGTILWLYQLFTEPG